MSRVRSRRLVWTLSVLAIPCCRGGNAPESSSAASFPESLDPLFQVLDSIRLERVGVFGFALDSIHGVVMQPDRVEPVGAGGAAILDKHSGELWWFENEPSWRSRIRSHGSAPGALGSPSDLAVIDDSLLLVMDPGNARISKFVRRERGLLPAGEIPHEHGGALCVVGRRLFVNAWIGGDVIHELGPTGELLRSFGTLPDAPGSELFGYFQPYVSARLLAGPFVCVSEPDLVVSVAAGLPTIEAFHLDGSLAWRTTLEDFNPVIYRTTGNRALRATFNPETGSHLARSAVRWTQNSLLVQYALIHEEILADDLDRQPVDSRLLDLRTGREISRSRAWPVILARSAEFVYRRVQSGQTPLVEVSRLRRLYAVSK